jgi:hypothetical protein
VVDGRECTAGSGVGRRSDCRQEDHREEIDARTGSRDGYRRGVDWHWVCVGVEHVRNRGRQGAESTVKGMTGWKRWDFP